MRQAILLVIGPSSDRGLIEEPWRDYPRIRVRALFVASTNRLLRALVTKNRSPGRQPGLFLRAGLPESGGPDWATNRGQHLGLRCYCSSPTGGALGERGEPIFLMIQVDDR